MTTPNTDKEKEACQLIDVKGMVLRAIRVAYGNDALVEEPIATGLRTMVSAPADVRQAVSLARLAQLDAGGVVNGYVRKARGAGVSWAELAVLLQVDHEHGSYGEKLAPGAAAEAAFRLVAGEGRAFEYSTLAWECSTCHQQVRDQGPFETHPSDREAGHAEDCARHTAAVRAHDREWTE